MSAVLGNVEQGYEMSGLSSGLYGEYANDVAISFARVLLEELKQNGKIHLTILDINHLLDSGKKIIQYES